MDVRGGVLVVIAGVIGGSAIAAHRRHAAGSPAEPLRGTPATPGRAYLALLALTGLNPTTVTYFVALVLGNGAEDDGPARSAVFVVAAFAASASWQLALASAGSALGRIVSGPRGRLATAVVSSIMVIGLAAVTAASV